MSSEQTAELKGKVIFRFLRGAGSPGSGDQALVRQYNRSGVEGIELTPDLLLFMVSSELHSL